MTFMSLGLTNHPDLVADKQKRRSISAARFKVAFIIIAIKSQVPRITSLFFHRL
jgi:hypothetical protein